ncbi:MAG: 1,6-anhydro-N-acetylmuramyl-L-alanine amidase AmpD [Cellvibrionales bacterium]|nr:1,6-anhydro-N-acetylmuramyl-L-alanine amidase AmpD [Cellvibrionales bacterium]
MQNPALKNGRYNDYHQRQSPHAEPMLEPVSLLVIHNISLPAGQFLTPFVDDLFMGCIDCTAHESFMDLQGLKVAAHFFINREGRVTQYVGIDQVAWHAGLSSFNGREGCNAFSLGVEMEGCDDVPYEDLQYTALIQLTKRLFTDCPMLTKERIQGHSDIAPGRKTDPGQAFDWQRYLSAL